MNTAGYRVSREVLGDSQERLSHDAAIDAAQARIQREIDLVEAKWAERAKAAPVPRPDLSSSVVACPVGLANLWRVMDATTGAEVHFVRARDALECWDLYEEHANNVRGNAEVWMVSPDGVGFEIAEDGSRWLPVCGEHKVDVRGDAVARARLRDVWRPKLEGKPLEEQLVASVAVFR